MKMVTLIPAKSRPEKCPAADYKDIQRQGPIEVPMLTAKEALRNSKGGYQIKVEGPPVAQMVAPSLEDMSDPELKRLYMMTLQVTGKKPGKQVSRAAMIQVIQSVEDSIEIVDE